MQFHKVLREQFGTVMPVDTIELRPIMLIEDEYTDSVLIRRAFEKAGVQNPIQYVNNGDDALARLEGIGNYQDRTQYPLPAFILLDLKLPGMHGLNILRWIRSRKELRLIPVVVLTNSADAVDVKSAYEAGANSYMLKPADRNEIDRVIEIIQHYWLQHNLAPPLVVRDRTL
jgi:CheY-like chemotaxis protein